MMDSLARSVPGSQGRMQSLTHSPFVSWIVEAKTFADAVSVSTRGLTNFNVRVTQVCLTSLHRDCGGQKYVEHFLHDYNCSISIQSIYFVQCLSQLSPEPWLICNSYIR